MNSRRSQRQAREATEAARTVPLGILYAQFIRTYPGEFYAPGRWPTRDGAIPFRLFYEMIGAMANIRASDQLTLYYAALLAGAQITGGDEGKSTRDSAVRSLTETAFPTETPPPLPPAAPPVAPPDETPDDTPEAPHG